MSIEYKIPFIIITIFITLLLIGLFLIFQSIFLVIIALPIFYFFLNIILFNKISINNNELSIFNNIYIIKYKNIESIKFEIIRSTNIKICVNNTRKKYIKLNNDNINLFCELINKYAEDSEKNTLLSKANWIAFNT